MLDLSTSVMKGRQSTLPALRTLLGCTSSNLLNTLACKVLCSSSQTVHPSYVSETKTACMWFMLYNRIKLFYNFLCNSNIRTEKEDGRMCVSK